MSVQTDIDAAKRFASAYKPSEDDHPDLSSRVAMFERAVDSEKGTGRTRVQAVHARTLVRFLGHIGETVPKATPAKKAAAPAAKKAGS